MKKILEVSILSGLLLFSGPALAESPCETTRTCRRLFGDDGTGNGTFLGCINCLRFDDNSVFNRFGDFGSRFSFDSIFNKFSPWGSKYSYSSACNPRATNPPIIVDGRGNFEAFLTVRSNVNAPTVDPREWGACDD